MSKKAGFEYFESGEGKPILLLHGIGTTLEIFKNQVDKIPGRLIAVNLPGYGNSDGLKHFTFENIYCRLKEFTSCLGLNEFSLMGHSLGGMLSIDFVCRDFNSIEKLYLIGTTPFFGSKSGSFEKEFLKARLDPIRQGKSMRKIANDSIKKLTGPNVSPELLTSLEEQMSSLTPQTWEASVRSLIGFNRKRELLSITKPCCIISGEYDKNAPPRTMQAMSKMLPNSSYYLMEGVGHMMQFEAPELFNKIICEFLEN